MASWESSWVNSPIACDDDVEETRLIIMRYRQIYPSGIQEAFIIKFLFMTCLNTNRIEILVYTLFSIN